MKKNNSNKELYNVWARQKICTQNKNYRDYNRYGGRGLTMFSEWIKDYNLWLSYIKKLDHYDECIKDPFKYTIDRVNNNYGYEPMNLRIVKMSTQAFNRRMQSNNTSGTTGIYKRKSRPSWTYELKIENKRYRKSGFKTM